MSASWDYLQLRTGQAPGPSIYENDVRVYADEDGVLHELQADGTDTVIGSGGAGVGNAVVRGPFNLAFDTGGLVDGVVCYTPTIGDILLDAWISVTAAWDGTTPKADLSQFSAETYGWLASIAAPVDLTIVDQDDIGTGMRGSGPTDSGIIQETIALPSSLRNVPAVFTTTDPVKVVVSQDGLKGGAATGATHGTAAVYLITATPTPLP